MKFTKMQGIGNDYVYVNCFKEKVDSPTELAIKVSERHFGIGSDGLILICPSDVADVRMDMYNLDGSRGEMCGNGVRCVGKYAYDHGIVDKTEITVETLAGIKYLSLHVVEDKYGVTDNGGKGAVDMVTVNMGAPVLVPEDVPFIMPQGESTTKVGDVEAAISVKLEANDTVYHTTCVSMGNPHSVIFVDDTDSLDLEKIGPALENHVSFPNRVNTEFVKVIDRTHVKMRVWERGSGETLACGTGACAVTVACILNGKTEDEITVSLLGGDLKIRWDREANLVYMTGPATTVFDGTLY